MDRFNDYKQIDPATEKSELNKKKGKCEIEEKTKKLIQSHTF